MHKVSEYEYEESAASIIGEGAFSQVYKGYHATTKKPVAIKRYQKECVKLEELQVIERLDSDFIVRLQLLGDDLQLESSFLHVVMELCDCDLERHLSSMEDGSGLSECNFRVLLTGLAKGYEVLHLNGIIHRDIKPENILLIYEKMQPNQAAEKKIQCAKLSDFGCSRLAIHKDRLETIAGSPMYMAPEVGANLIDRSLYNAQVDMWSIGVVLFQALTGQVPFNECSLCRLFLHAADRNYKAFSCPSLPDGTSTPKRTLVQALLQIDSKQRLTAPEFLESVTKWDSLINESHQESGSNVTKYYELCKFDVLKWIEKRRTKKRAERGWWRKLLFLTLVFGICGYIFSCELDTVFYNLQL